MNILKKTNFPFPYFIKYADPVVLVTPEIKKESLAAESNAMLWTGPGIFDISPVKACQTLNFALYIAM